MAEKKSTVTIKLHCLTPNEIDNIIKSIESEGNKKNSDATLNKTETVKSITTKNISVERNTAHANAVGKNSGVSLRKSKDIKSVADAVKSQKIPAARSTNRTTANGKKDNKSNAGSMDKLKIVNVKTASNKKKDVAIKIQQEKDNLLTRNTRSATRANANGNKDDKSNKSSMNKSRSVNSKTASYKKNDVAIKIQQEKNNLPTRTTRSATRANCNGNNDKSDECSLNKLSAKSTTTTNENNDVSMRSTRPKRSHRNMEDDHKKPEGKKMDQRKRHNKLTLKEKISRAAPINDYVINELIMATVPGYSPWPARIIDIIGETIVVEFFGTGQR